MTPCARHTAVGPSPGRWLPAFALIVALGFGFAAPAAGAVAAADTPKPKVAKGAADATEGLDPERLFEAIVKVQTRAVPNARSAATLGEEREGTGIVIGEGGLILTIGYLIVEADEVKVQDSRGRTLPAKLVGYDHATGFGLVRTIAPMSARPIAFGDSSKLAERAPVMIVNSDGANDVSLAFVASRRQFAANWEYMIEGAIFTTPPATNWSGAALIDREGKLMGVGSLVVRDAAGGERSVPGNMFVPIDLLKPVLADMIKTGRRAGPARPWLGVSADEQLGRLYVTRVSPDGPGDSAGLKPGDIILGVGGEGVRTQEEFYRKLWSQGAAGTDIRLRVLQGIDVKDMQVHSIDRVEYFRPQTTF